MHGEQTVKLEVRVVQTDDVAIAQVEEVACWSSATGWPSSDIEVRQALGTGSSKRHPGDPRNRDLGRRLAELRALRDAAETVADMCVDTGGREEDVNPPTTLEKRLVAAIEAALETPALALGREGFQVDPQSGDVESVIVCKADALAHIVLTLVAALPPRAGEGDG